MMNAFSNQISAELSGLSGFTPNQQLEFLKSSRDPQGAIDSLSSASLDPIRKMWRPGFEGLIDRLPKIDPNQRDQSLQVEITKMVLEEVSQLVRDNMSRLNLPKIPDGQFGRVILDLEEPRSVNGELIGGTEVIIALWGRGFSSPVHGHAAGFVNETLVEGAFNVHLFEAVGEPAARTAIYQRTIEQRDPGIFYSEFIPNIGQQTRSSVIHNFIAVEPSISVHYLPEHVRNGDANRFSVVNTPQSAKIPSYTPTMEFRSGFEITDRDVTRIQPQEMRGRVQKGDVYLVRSQNVPYLGDHYAMITSDEFVQKPHGLRPQDVSVRIPYGQNTPLNNLPISDSLALFALNDSKRREFYEHYDVSAKIRRS